PGMNSGLEFNYLMRGGDRTLTVFMGLGTLGEGYWNGGWLGGVVVGVVVGVLLAALALFSVRIVGGGRLTPLAISMAGIMMGLRIDDWFLSTYLGFTVQLFVMYLILQYVVRPILFDDTSVRTRAVQKYPRLSKS